MIRIILIFSVLLIKTGYSPKTSEQSFEKAYFASGCFWCVEGIYENIKGVIEVNSGYSGGRMKNPTYQQVIRGKTGHAETVEIIYDPEIIDFKTLVNVFFGSHDPSTLNRQSYLNIAFFESSGVIIFSMILLPILYGRKSNSGKCDST